MSIMILLDLDLEQLTLGMRITMVIKTLSSMVYLINTTLVKHFFTEMMVVNFILTL